MGFSSKLKKLRLQHNLTQEELGKKINVTKVSISGYENGNRTPDMDTMARLADVFSVSVDFLMDRTETSSTNQTTPDWATVKDKRDIKEILDDNLPVMFDGKPVNEEDKQRLTDLITGFLWDSKEKNKKTYGRKKNIKNDTSDNNAD